MEVSKDVIAVRKVIEACLKAKKMLKMYPNSHPMYKSNLENTIHTFNEFFEYADKLTLKFHQHEISYDSVTVYSNQGTRENMAFLFFKDGLREISFYKEVTCEEIEDFLKIIAMDFDQEAADDDIVTILWQRDFEHIEYYADDTFITDEDVRELEGETRQDETPDVTDLKEAYEDALEEPDGFKSVPLMPVSEEDYQLLMVELEKDNKDKLEQFYNVLFELMSDAEKTIEYEDIVFFFMKTFEYNVKQRRFDILTQVLTRLRQIMAETDAGSELKKNAMKILMVAGSQKIIRLVGEMLDSEEKMSKDDFQNFIKCLDKKAISPFLGLLGEMNSIYARKMVVGALVLLGPHDIFLLTRRLNSSKWFVVRNILYVLKLIGDRSVLKHVEQMVKHKEPRVIKEALRTLASVGDDSVLGTLQECLNEEDMNLRMNALTAIGSIGSESAKKIIMTEIEKASFIEKEFSEKNEYFRTLSRWNDRDVYDFCLKTIAKKSFWKRSKLLEVKACAAYLIGILGETEALPLLNKCRKSGNRLLQEYSGQAIERIESGA